MTLTNSTSPELDADTRLVNALYRGILHRDPSPDEVAAWLAGLRSSDPHYKIVGADAAEAFLASEERKNLLANLVAPSQSALPADWPQLFVPPGHFYSPIVDPSGTITEKRHGERPMPEQLTGLDIDRVSMLAAWTELLPHFLACPFGADRTPGFRYWFDNPAYSYADGATLFAMIRRHRPKRIVEVGCGWSSACMLDTIDRELFGLCETTFIEPYPQLLRELTAANPFTGRIIETAVQDVDLSEFERLEANDILFIDSTHVLKTGSDVAFELAEILPRLQPGVLVHFHDIFWPFEYPDAWIFEENRSWNEIYALRAFLTDSRDWKVEFFGHYLVSIEGGRVESDFPLFTKNPGGAIWLRKHSLS